MSAAEESDAKTTLYNMSRREFLGRTSGVAVVTGLAGGVAAGGLATQEVEADCTQSEARSDPRRDYPLNVSVGPHGRATLYALLGPDAGDYGRPVRDVFEMNFVDILGDMIDVLDRPTEFPNDPFDGSSLIKADARAALVDLKEAIEQGNPQLSLEEMCVNPPSEWASNPEPIKDAALEADGYFCMPFIRVDRSWAEKFLRSGEHHGAEFFDYIEHWSMYDLFTSPVTDLTRTGRWLVLEARKKGLLWCNPKGQPGLPPEFDSLMSAEAKKTREAEKRDEPNGCECKGDDTCGDGSADDHCEMVDGTCSTMSG